MTAPRTDPDLAAVGVPLEDLEDAPAPARRASTTASHPRQFARGSDPHAAPVAQEEPWHVTPTDIAASEWGRRVMASIEAGDARWKWTKRLGAILAPMIVTGFLTGLAWLRSSSDAGGAAREREAIRRDDHGDIQQLKIDLAVLGERIRAIEAVLTRMPIGFVPIAGPPTQPPGTP